MVVINWKTFLIVFLVTSSLLILNRNTSFYADRELYCIELVEKGVLYGGQTLCGNPPMTYFVGYALSYLFGLENIQVATGILMLFMVISCLAVVLKFSATDDLLEQIAFLCFAAVFFLYNIQDLASSLAVFFVCLAYFFMHRNSLIIAGFLSGLGILSKVTVLLFLPVILLIILHTCITQKQKFVKKLIYFVLPIISLLILTYFFYPFAYHYSVTIHSIMHTKQSLVHTLQVIFVPFLSGNFNMQHLIAFLITSIGIIGFVLFRNIDSLFLVPVSFWYAYIATVGSLFSTGDPVFHNFFMYYYLIFFPFLFITVMNIIKYSKNKSKMLYAFSCISFILFLLQFGINAGVLNDDNNSNINSNEIQIVTTKVSSFYNTLVYDSGFIITDTDMAELLPQKYSERIILSIYTNLTNPKYFGFGDPNYGEGITKMYFYNSSALNPKFLKDKKQFSNTLNSTITFINKYNATTLFVGQTYVMSPLYFSAHFMPILKDYNITDTFPALQNQYCTVSVPILKGSRTGRQWGTILYAKPELCSIATKQVYEFIDSNFELFCNFDQQIADTYNYILTLNKMSSNKKCKSLAFGYQDVDKKPNFINGIIFTAFLLSIILISRQKLKEKTLASEARIKNRESEWDILKNNLSAKK